MNGARHRRHAVGAALCALLVVLVLVVSGCSSGGPQPPSSGPPVRTTSTLPPTCAATARSANQVSAVLDSAAPGRTLCFTGDELADTDIVVRASGTPAAPLVLQADGAVVRGIDVAGQYVVIEGFSVARGTGIDLDGAFLMVRGNALSNTQDDGIDCDPCTDTTVEHNIVDGSDGTGIRVEGERVAVRDNTVSRSVKRRSGDADGIRFFGVGLHIEQNTIRDISARGYPAGVDPPHTDCFQTYDDDSPTTYDVVISRNTCTNVDAQCLIATGNDRGNEGVPPGRRAIAFMDNTCETHGSQLIFTEHYPLVEVRRTQMRGDQLYRGIYLSENSVDGLVTDNTMYGVGPPLEVDESSQPGLVAANNVNVG